MYLQQRHPIRIIKRPKRSRVGDHWGVQLPDGRVVHLTPEGLRLETFDEFVDGKEWAVVRTADPTRETAILSRVAEALRSPPRYRVHDKNCEVFANEMLGDPPVSPQVQSVLVVGAILFVLKVS